MSVNDLVERLGSLAQSRWDSWRNGAGMEMQGQSDAYDVAANMVAEVAHAAWHPVSEPPTAEDADEKGQVLEYWFETQGGFWIVTTTDYHWIRNWADQEDAEIGHKWARIRDVILMPPQGGE